ncbi:putative ribonuclease H-like domain-containing protein [Tanacetum coccineum]
MDVKSAFLYGTIEEEVYATQPPGFKDPNHPDKVYKVVKMTLSLAYINKGVMLWFLRKLMKDKFQMSSMGELTFFLGVQVQQKEDGIFISQDKYVVEIMNKFNYFDVKFASTPVDLEKPLVKDGDADDVDVHLYRSMIGSLMYLTASRPDIMFAVCACARFQCKKQIVDATSTTEAEYMAATSCSGQFLLLVYFTAAKLMLGSVNAVRHMLMLPVQVPAAEGVSINTSIKEIIDFLKASSVHYALTVNPIIYTSCIEQFWTTAKVQTVNGVRQLQALVDKKRVIVTESSIRRDLHLDDAEGTDYLPTATIFEELARMGYEKPSQKLTFYKAFFSPQWKYFIHTITQCLSAKSTAWNEFSCSMASLIIFFINQQLGDMSTHKKIFVNPFHTKKVFANMKRAGKDFSRRITPLFDIMMVQPSEEVGEDSDHPTNSTQVLDLEKAKDAQVKAIVALKKRIQKLERKKMSRPTGLKRLKKVGMSRRVESSEDQESLVAPEDASKHGRSIADIDADIEVTLVDETQKRQDDELMFDTRDLDTDEMPVEAKVNEKDEQSTKPDDSTANEAVTADIGGVAAAKIDELTLAQTLIEIKAAKPKVVTTTATTTTTTRPKAKGVVVVQEPSEFRVPQEAQPSVAKDKGKGIMIEPEVPLKRKDQIALDEQIARDIQAKLDAELIMRRKAIKKQ